MTTPKFVQLFFVLLVFFNRRSHKKTLNTFQENIVDVRNVLYPLLLVKEFLFAKDVFWVLLHLLLLGRIRAANVEDISHLHT